MNRKYASIFTGIGGFDLAADQLRLEYTFGSEIDKFAIQTYEENFNRSVAGDITEIPANLIPDHDILLAGFPCQDFSLGGKRKGITGERGNLFYEIPRILKAKQPKAFLLENVKGLLTDSYALNIILTELNAAGYNVSYSVLNSRNFGVPQNRERVFFMGFRKDIAPTFITFPVGLTQFTTLKDVLEPTVDQKYYLSERYLTSLKERGDRHKGKGGGFTYEYKKMDDIAGTIHVGGSSLEANLIDCCYLCHPDANIKQREQKRDVTWTLGTSGSDMGIKDKQNRIRRLTPREYARLQGFPDTFSIPVSDTQAYKQFGNAVTVPVIKALLKRMLRLLGDN